MSVSLLITSPDTQSERTYSLSLTIGDIKRKLYSVTGIPVASQSLTLSRSESSSSTQLSDDDKPLGFYGVTNGMHIQARASPLADVSDLDPSVNLTGQFNDVSGVDKFEISREEYEKRPGTVKAFKEANRMGRFAESKPSNIDALAEPSTQAKCIPIGSRCRLVDETGAAERRGTVRFVGTTAFGKSDDSIWVGIELDEPLGKNDGSVQGQRYFQCASLYGVFVRPIGVDVGNFPPVDLLEDDEM